MTNAQYKIQAVIQSVLNNVLCQDIIGFLMQWTIENCVL